MITNDSRTHAYFEKKRFFQKAFNSELRYTVFFNHVQILILGRAELKQEHRGFISIFQL